MDLDVIVEVVDPARAAALLPSTGDTAAISLVVGIFLAVAAVALLARRRLLPTRTAACAHTVPAHAAPKDGTSTAAGSTARRAVRTALGALCAAALVAAALWGGGALRGFAEDGTVRITLTRGQGHDVQSTVAVPLALDAAASHGSSVLLACASSDLGTFKASLAAPAALPAGTVGFALSANPAPTKANTVPNGFGASYAPAANAKADTRLFAALPKTRTLVLQSSAPSTSKAPTRLYLSAKASPALEAGTYHVRLRLEVVENVLMSLDAGEGTGTTSPLLAFAGAEVTVPAAPADFVRTGHRFASWNSAPDGTGKAYRPGDTLGLTTDVTLYAQWEPESYTVSYHANAPSSATGTVTSASGMPAQTAAYGKSLRLVPNDFTLAGHVFRGWNTEPDGASGTDYADAQAFSPWILMADLHLYAKWELATYALAFDKNGGDTEANPASRPVTYGAAVGTLPASGSGAPVRAGYTFSGWSADPGAFAAGVGTGNVADFFDTTTVDWTGPKAVYAVWTANPHTLSFDAGGGTGTMAAFPVNFGQTKALAPNGFARPGYNFTGWATSAGGPVVYADGADYTLTADADLRLWAVWADNTPLAFTVTVAAGEEFLVPVNGYGTSGAGAPYAWDIEWGDGETSENETGVSTPNTTYQGHLGIPHTYTGAGTYTVTIRPHDPSMPFGWARAFGFAYEHSGSSVAANKAKVQSVVSMPARGFLESATSTGDFFLNNLWYGCSGLVTAVVPDTSDYEIRTVGTYFLSGTWYYCTGLVDADVPDTSGWPVTDVGRGFLELTWYHCDSLVDAVVPDTSGWPVTDLDTYFFLCSTWDRCSSLVNADVPDTSGWKVDAIADSFLVDTWTLCTSLATAVAPDTSDWRPASIGSNFMARTWQHCSNLAAAAVPDTSDWRPTDIGTWFMTNTWRDCSSLATAGVAMLDTEDWDVDSIGNNFLFYTWYDCIALKDLSGLHFSDSFKDVPDLYSNLNNWNRTFHWSTPAGSATGAPPSFYDGTPITATAPTTPRATFTNRNGMPLYASLNPNWTTA